MTTAVRTAATKRPPMDSMRKTALAAGVFYLLSFISIPSLALYGVVKNDPSFIISAGNDTGILVGGFLEMIVALAGIGSAIALFSVIKRQHEGLALGLVATRLFEGGVIAIGVMSILSVVTLRQPGATGAEAASLVTTGQTLVGVHNWAFLLGQSLMPALNALLLGTVMYRSGLVPRILPVLGLIGAPLLIATTIATLFGVLEQWSTLGGLSAMPIFAWELGLGLWLTFKGFKASAPLMIAAAARSDSPDGPATALPSRTVVAGCGSSTSVIFPPMKLRSMKHRSSTFDGTCIRTGRTSVGPSEPNAGGNMARLRPVFIGRWPLCRASSSHLRPPSTGSTRG